MKISKVFITEKCVDFLEKKNLVLSWKKAKMNILEGNFSSVSLKKRRPYKSEKWYFRLNKQYRAIGFLEGEILKIFEINDHQND